jgi:homocysteine S-methyltransferase
MLETLERMAAATGARLSAQPNAGRPREVEGRTIYLTSPEYMASYARRFADRGVRLVGGCCGTTPEHIAQMKRALTRSTRPSGVRIGPTVTSAGTAAASNLPQSPQPSALMTALRERGWARLVELMPPIGFAMASATEQARRLRARGVDAVHIPEAPSGPRLQAMSMAVLLQQQAQIDTLLEYSSRDKPLVGMQSELLGAFAMGVRNLLAVTGDVRQVGDYTDATAVLDVDSIGLVNAVSRLNRGLGVGGQSIGDPTAFHVGVTVNPGADDLENELRRFEWKVEAGAHFIITRPIFDVAAFERMHRRIEDARLPLVLSLRPFASLLDAEYQANEVPGVRVPKEVLDRIRRCDDAAAEGVAIAGEVGRALRPMVHGVNIVPPAGRLDLGLLLLDALD